MPRRDDSLPGRLLLLQGRLQGDRVRNGKCKDTIPDIKGSFTCQSPFFREKLYQLKQEQTCFKDLRHSKNFLALGIRKSWIPSRSNLIKPQFFTREKNWIPPRSEFFKLKYAIYSTCRYEGKIQTAPLHNTNNNYQAITVPRPAFLR